MNINKIVFRARLLAIFVAGIAVVIGYVGMSAGTERRNSPNKELERYVFFNLHWGESPKSWNRPNDLLYESVLDMQQRDLLELVLFRGYFDASSGKIPVAPIEMIVFTGENVYGVREIHNEIEVVEYEERVQKGKMRKRALDTFKAECELIGDWEEFYHIEIRDRTAGEIISTMMDEGMFELEKDMYSTSGYRIGIFKKGYAYYDNIHGRDIVSGDYEMQVEPFRISIDKIMDEYLKDEYEVTDSTKKDEIKENIIGALKKYNVWIDEHREKEHQRENGLDE